MIIHDKFIFLHNCHCGGNSVRSILQDLFPSAKSFPLNSGHWHKPVRALYANDYWGRPVAEITDKDKYKIKFGFVRNPWDWYVSFYHHQRTTGRFYQTYTSNGKTGFKYFLKNLLSQEYNATKNEVLFYPPGDAEALIVPKCAILSKINFGFFTYRFIYTFIKDFPEILDGTIELNSTNICSYISVDSILKVEKLVKDLFALFSRYHIKPEVKWKQYVLYAKSIFKPMSLKKGAVARDQIKYQHYYDEELKQLVYDKDELVIKYFDYQF